MNYLLKTIFKGFKRHWNIQLMNLTFSNFPWKLHQNYLILQILPIHWYPNTIDLIYLEKFMGKNLQINQSSNKVKIMVQMFNLSIISYFCFIWFQNINEIIKDLSYSMKTSSLLKYLFDSTYCNQWMILIYWKKLQLKLIL